MKKTFSVQITQEAGKGVWKNIYLRYKINMRGTLIVNKEDMQITQSDLEKI